ncbi:predicted protein [Aspergillus nidulans FGSC A4]|uniref:Uncharacterized protein n=1 Tax=Emericella nidulans (strain FGSC A4 / ATCC 38163 / CBS 112.46 / NRRL 194 / M139) TaxID=227321 RepID=Q5B9Q8_EMENI|nr:hypothetical protein [Aspergillus nidulans FGSC A4]EAA63020.1 predicted protein [Aspergillus nidulans FGSC A4]CBF84148.1 TPA: hypothetical protein ANIA_02722 [Aspergillus nidulans FGSC A4]|eukprot:XP_660326.1 predicted protein [Aspergillus nidulans FGSC A4]
MTYKDSFGHPITSRKASLIVVYAYARRILAPVELWIELHTSPQTTRSPVPVCHLAYPPQRPPPARAVTAATKSHPVVSSSARAVSPLLLTSLAKRPKPLPDHLLASDIRSVKILDNKNLNIFDHKIRATVDRDRTAAHSITS